jgi:DNA-binding beta-propeller fold protein YncE
LTALPAFTLALPGGAQPRGMATDSDGHLFVAFAALDQVGQYSINTSTGQLTLLGAPLATGTTPDRVELTPNGQFVYVSNFFGTSVSIYSHAGAGLTAVGTQSTGSPSRPLGLVVHQNGAFLVVSLNSALVTDNVIVYRTLPVAR